MNYRSFYLRRIFYLTAALVFFATSYVPAIATDAAYHQKLAKQFYAKAVKSLIKSRNADHFRYVSPCSYPEETYESFRQSMDHYKEFVEMKGKEATADDYMKLGSASYNSSKYDIALSYYEKALELSGNHAPAKLFIKIAEAHYQKNDEPSAKHYYEKAKSQNYTLNELDDERYNACLIVARQSKADQNNKQKAENSKPSIESIYNAPRSAGTTVKAVTPHKKMKSKRSDNDGMYYIECKINGASTERLIYDTGATMTHIPYEYYKKVNMNASRLIFNVKVKTANGISLNALARIDIEVPNIMEVYNLEVLIGPKGTQCSPLFGQDLMQLLKCNIEHNTLTYEFLQ